MSPAYPTREQASADAFAARPEVQQCTTCKAQYFARKWQDTEDEIETHHRNEAP